MRHDRIAVTGGGGRLGRHVVAELARFAEVTVLDRMPCEPPGQTGHRFVAIDILDLPALGRTLAGHDAVVHLAAIDAGTEVPPEVYFETNVQGTWNVLHAAESLGIRKAVIASSVSATGIGRDNPAAGPRYLPIDEAHPLSPNGVYGVSKEIDETIARCFARRGGLSVVCLRPTLIVRDEVVGQVDNLARLEDGDPDAETDYDTSGLIEPFEGPLPLLRAYIGSADAARCFRHALEAETGSFDCFFVSARDSIGHVETLPHLERALGVLPEIRRPELYARDPHAGAIDISRAREILGWEPEGDWTTMVATRTPPPR